MIKRHIAVVLMLAPLVSSAQIAIPQPVQNLLFALNEQILNPLIALMFAVALASFFYGIVIYIWNPDNDELRSKGRTAMVWGIVGMFIMVSVFAIMRFIINSIGANQNLMDYV